uniref:Ycf2 protein n=1 Tax=Campanula zangezura TaxID=440380 RepID=A0A890CG08_9ASTR|nr:Ycf2 protein [Campanula zangezura]QRG30855.1 Ycf2 protein [Campanula zangezura]
MDKRLKVLMGEFKQVLRETKNSPQLTSVGYFIQNFFDIRRFIQLFDPSIWRIVLSYIVNPPRLTLLMKISRFCIWTIKNAIFFVVAVLVYRINNRNLVERKRFLLGLFPIPRNFIGRKNDRLLEEDVGSSHINRFVLSLLSPPKGNKISEMKPDEIIQSSMPESNRLSRWWKNWIRNSIQFKGSSNQSLELDSMMTQREIQQLKESAILEDPYFMETDEGETDEEETDEEETEEVETEEVETEEVETEEVETEEVETEEVETDQAVENSAMSRIEQFLRNPRRSVPSFFSDGWSELQLDSNPTERSTRDQKLLHDFSVIRRSETIDMVKLFKTLLYLHNTVSIQPISKDPGYAANARYYLSGFDPLSNLLILSINAINEDLIYTNVFDLFSLKYCIEKLREEMRQDPTQIGNPCRRGSPWRKNPWVPLSRTLYEERKSRHNFEDGIQRDEIEKDTLNHNFEDGIQRDEIEKDTLNHNFEDGIQRDEIEKDTLNHNFEDGIQRDEIEKDTLNHNFEDGIQRDEIEKDTLNHRIPRKYTINQHLSNFFLEKGPWFADLPLFDRSMRRAAERYTDTFTWTDITQKDFVSEQLDDDESCKPLERQSLLFYPRGPIGESLMKDLFPDKRLRVHMKWLFEDTCKKLDNMYSDFSMIFDDPYNWVHPLKPFEISSEISSLISFFYKAHQRPFERRKTDYFSQICNKKFPFSVKRARLNNSDFIYRQFLNTFFIRNKKRNKKFSLGVGQKIHAFSERDILSAIQSEISKIFRSKDFVQTGEAEPIWCRDPYLDIYLKRDPIVDICTSDEEKPELLVTFEEELKLEPEIENLETTYCQPLSDMNLFDSEGKHLHESFSDMNLFDSEEKNLDQSFSDINLFDSERTNVDELLSDIDRAELEGTQVDESFSDMNLFDLQGTKVDESLSDLDLADLKVDELLSDIDRAELDELFSDLDRADLEDIDRADLEDLDRADLEDIDLAELEIDLAELEAIDLADLEAIDLAELEGTKVDESLSELNRADLEATEIDESLSDLNRADLEGTKVDESLSELNRADLEGTKVDESLSELNRADLEGTEVDESLSDLNRADLEGTEIDESLSDLNLADLEGTEVDESELNLADLEGDEINKLFYLERFYRSLKLNSKSFLVPYTNFKSKSFFIPSSSFDKFLSLELEKRKNDCRSRNKDDGIVRKEQLRSLYLRTCYKKMRMDRNKKSLASAFSIRSKGELFQKYLAKTKWKLFKRYLPWALTSTGLRYLTALFLDIVSDLWGRIWDRRRWRIRIIEIDLYLLRLKRKWTRKWRRKWTEKWTKAKKKWPPKFKKWATQLKKVDAKLFRLTFLLKRIKTVFETCLDTGYRETFYRKRKNRSPRNRRNLREFFILMDLLVLVVACLVSKAFLQGLDDWFLIARKFKTAQALIIDEVLIEIELEELMAEYPPYESPDFGLRVKNFFLGLLEKMLFPNPYGLRVKKKRKFFNINLRPIIKLINVISKEINFAIKTRSISHTSKEIYSFIRKRKKVTPYWDQTADWVSNNYWIDNQEREVLMQFVNLKRERSISEILWSLTHSDEYGLKDEVLPEMIEQPGEVYLRKVIDFHKKDLLNYEFNPFSLAEKRIFLALYHTMTYSQTSSGVDPSLSRQKPFSLRLTLAPSKSILVIGCIGLGRSYLVNYLAKNSYLPFVTIILHKFRGTIYRFEDILDEEDEYDSDDEIEVLIESRDEIGLLSEDIKAIDHVEWSHYMRVLANFVTSFFMTSFFIKPSYDYDAHPDLEQISMDDQTDDMDTVLYVHKFYMSLQIELAKAMSPCLIWIPNIHELDFSDSDFFSIGLLSHLLSWDCERSSSSNNLVIASTHMPQKMQPSLIDTHRFNTCIKVRRPVISQQRKHFSTLLYTRGFDLESEIFRTTHGFESITLGSNAQDLAALTNEALSISLTEGKSIIDSNTIRHAVHRQNWDLRAEVRPINNSRILFYQIGRVVVHYLLLRDCPIDPISIYMNKRFCPERDPYLYRWYYQLGMSMKKLTILIYVLNCSAGLVAQDLWSRSELNANNGIALGSFVENNSDLVHGLLEIEGVLEGFLPTEKHCSQFDKDRVPVLRRPEPRKPSDMIHNGFWSMIDQSMIYQKDPLAPPIVIGGIKIDLPKMFADFVVWSPRIWSPWGFLLNWIERFNANELGFPSWSRSFFAKQIEAILFNYDEDDLEENDQENDSHSNEDQGEENRDPVEEKEKKKERPTFYKLEDEDQDGYGPNFNPLDYDYDDDVAEAEAFVQSVYQTRARIRSSQEQIFFRISRFIWDPGNPLLILSDDPFIVAMFSAREFFPDVEAYEDKWFFTAEIKSLKKSWFLDETQEKYGDWLIQRQRWLRRPNNSFSKGSFRSTALSESYQYLSNLFLSNRTVVNEMKKLLVSKRWLFPDDMQNFFYEQYSPAETRKI